MEELVLKERMSTRASVLRDGPVIDARKVNDDCHYFILGPWKQLTVSKRMNMLGWPTLLCISKFCDYFHLVSLSHYAFINMDLRNIPKQKSSNFQMFP